MPISIVTGAVAAAAAAALALGATGQQGSTNPPAGSLVTTAVIRQMASATEAALAKSGRVLMVTRAHGLVTNIDKNGHRHNLVEVDTDTYSFSGKDYNVAERLKVPGAPGNDGVPGRMIVRLVRGQRYELLAGFPCPPKQPHCDRSKLRWYHLVGHLTKYRGMADPRGILKVLAPSAKFVSEGTQTIHGVRTTRLRATKLAGLPRLGALPNVPQSGEKLTGLLIWVDTHGVVRQIHLSGRTALFRNGHATYPRSDRFTTAINFLDIGVRQHIVAPRHAIRYVSK